MTQADLMHEYQHAVAAGHIHNNEIHLHDGSVATIAKKPNTELALYIKEDGGKFKMGEHIDGADAIAMYEEAVNSGEAGRIIYGANLQENEYGPQQYGQFFFFITGFHGFHVFSGVMINIIILLGVMRGLYHKRGHYEMVEKTGLYWHFVDLVWVFVFTFFYLV
jgi:cytochrome c oxidase subunit 3